MEATMLSVGKSVLSGALGYAKSAFAEELALQLGIERDHAFIRDEMEMMQSFLMVAHDDREGNKVVKTWVKQVRDVAYDVEDCLQDFAVRLGKKSWWRFPFAVQERRRIAKKMKELRAKVEDVSKRNTRYQLIKSSSSQATTGNAQSSANGVTMSGTYEEKRQRQKAKEDLVQLINKTDDNRRVIAVWGTNGDLTSIIGTVYDDVKRDNKKLECCACISLIHPMEPIHLMQAIINEFYINSLQEDGKGTAECQVLRRIAAMQEKDLAASFYEYMKDKCYLIVLTDLSTIEEWKDIKTCFPDNKNGSRIVVSTQQIKVASLCAGTEEVAPEHQQLYPGRNLYAFYSKDSKDETNSADPSSRLNITTIGSDISEEGESHTQTDAKGLGTKKGSKDGINHSIDPSPSINTTTSIALDEFDLIERVLEKDDIIKLILDDSKKLEKISVWGMGGLGKTTLVQDIYRSEEVNQQFDKHVCVTIMRPFNHLQLLTSLLDQLDDSKTSEAKKHTLLKDAQKSLGECLEGKKYLVVLDDVLFIEEWDAIARDFPDSNKGSRIVITTRSEEIALRCSRELRWIYHLQFLGDNDAKDLFIKKVFNKSEKKLEHYPELAEPAKQIMKKCSGLPLAIVTIGGFLANQAKTASVWRNLNDHISAEFETNPELDTIRNILNKSYDGLPYHLKSCFLYLSIFPEDYKISRKRLVRRWAAEGYSKERYEKSAEEIGDKYFFELLHRSVILPTTSTSGNKETNSCQVHDLMRDIATSKSEEENLVLGLNVGNRLHHQGVVRHLAITSRTRGGDEFELETIVDMSRVRSLTVFGFWRPFFISNKMRLLRVLDLEDTLHLCDHHLKDIWKLVHLKYLSLRGCRKICYLPDSLGNLRQLETLDIRGTYIVRLPTTIVNLRKLKYLRSGVRKFHCDHTEDELRNRLSLMTTDVLLCCAFCIRTALMDSNNRRDICTKFCCGILPVVAMHQLDVNGIVAPKGLRSLNSLHTLGVVDISSSSTVLQDIRRLIQLCKLGVSGVNKKNSEQFISVLGFLDRLKSLSLSVHPQVEPNLDGGGKFSPPRELKSLQLHGYLGKLPAWIKQLNNLEKLRLEETNLKDQAAAIQVLGKLPNLTILRLLFMSFMSGELVFPDRSFGSLVVLEYRDYKCSIKFKQGALQKLELLLLTYDPVKIAGLEFLPSIRDVQVARYWKRNQLRLDSVQAQVAAHPNKPILKVLN